MKENRTLSIKDMKFYFKGKILVKSLEYRVHVFRLFSRLSHMIIKLMGVENNLISCRIHVQYIYIAFMINVLFHFRTACLS